jgi:hypothetical protein
LPTMKKRVVLHIGLPKTGSTAVQLSLFNSLEFRQRNSICYPRSGQNSLFSDNGHHLLAIAYMLDRWEELGLRCGRADVETVWDALLAEINCGGESVYFVSSEWFAFDVYRA